MAARRRAEAPAEALAAAIESETPVMAAEDGVPPVVGSVDPAAMKVSDLRDALSARGLSTKGLKKELQERLEAAIRGGPTAGEGAGVGAEATSGDEGVGAEATGGDEGAGVEAADSVAPGPAERREGVKAAGSAAPATADRDEEVDYSVHEPAEGLATAPMAEAGSPHETEVSAHAISHIVCIGGFVRPFTQQAARELVEAYGAVVDFWMDAVRSQCFVEYASGAEAEQCWRALDGLQWPEGTGRALVAAASDADAMRDARAQDRRRRASDDTAGAAADGASPAPKRLRSLDELFRKTATKPVLYYLPAK